MPSTFSQSIGGTTVTLRTKLPSIYTKRNALVLKFKKQIFLKNANMHQLSNIVALYTHDIYIIEPYICISSVFNLDFHLYFTD